MGLSAAILQEGIDWAAARDPRIAAGLAAVGYPEPRRSDKGFPALLRIMVGQQLSVKAAATIHGRLIDLLGGTADPLALLAAEDAALRAAGLSRQKTSYGRALAQATIDRALDFEAFAELDDEAAIDAIASVKGFGRWSGEIYLLFCEGRRDVWPAADLGLQVGLQRLFMLPERPTAKATHDLVAHVRPHRGALAIFLWHMSTFRPNRTI